MLKAVWCLGQVGAYDRLALKAGMLVLKACWCLRQVGA